MISPMSDDICQVFDWQQNYKMTLSLFHQVRLDFEEVELLDPDSTGACRTDYMHVTGGVSQVFLTSSLKSSSWPPLLLNSLQSLNSHNPDWFIYSNISFHFLIVSSTRPCQPCVVPWQASTSSTRRSQTSQQGIATLILFSKFTILNFWGASGLNQWIILLLARLPLSLSWGCESVFHDW